MQLRPYQVEAKAAIHREHESVRSTLLVLATGLGKTVVFSTLALDYIAKGQRVLVLAHRTELVTQAKATLERMGVTVGIEMAGQKVDRLFLPDVVIASVQTLQKRRLESFSPELFGLVIIDEAHHTAAKSYMAIVEYFAAAKVLGVTATPDRGDGRALALAYESCAYRMEIGAGIKHGYLSPIEAKTITVEGLDLSQVKVVAGELHQGELGAMMEDDEVLLGIADPLSKEAGQRQTICFCASVLQAHQLAKLLNERGVKAAAIDATTPKEEREKVLADYHAKRLQVVTNAMILTEGFDAPETSCIALARPTGSRALLAQMIGRGTRLAEGKERCLVLDFVPQRKAKIRLKAPADVLGGDMLDPAVAEYLAELEGNGMTLDEQLALAEQMAEADRQKELEEQKRRRLQRREYLKKVGIAYAAHVIPLDQLLGEVCPLEEGEPLATPDQCDRLIRAGYREKELAGISKRQADVLLKICRVRRERGLCTIKQSRLLQRHGLRADAKFEDAPVAIDAIMQNNWSAPSWLFQDPRFAVEPGKQVGLGG